MTIPPSAASGKRDSSGRSNSSDSSAATAATSEYTWLRLPVARAMAVLVALLLTGKPRSRPAPTLATPSASNSRLATMVSSGRLNDRAVSTSSLKPTISTVNAGSTSSRTTPG